jgi:hypothetical protein
MRELVDEGGSPRSSEDSSRDEYLLAELPLIQDLNSLRHEAIELEATKRGGRRLPIGRREQELSVAWKTRRVEFPRLVAGVRVRERARAE